MSPLLAGAFLFFAVLLSQPAIAATELASTRAIVDLEEGWRFKLGEGSLGQVDPVFDDSGWEKVSVPHSWNRIGEYRTRRSSEANNTQGVGWYRLRFAAPPVSVGKRVYLDFGAVGAIADVWVNGSHVGQHKGAFSRFRFDVTEQWRPGADNVIAVRADNTKPAIGSSTEDVIPLSGDFFVHGGIYRGVLLITAEEAGIDLLDLGGPGIYAHTETIRPKTDARSHLSADVVVESRLRNQGGKDRRLVAVATIRDAAGIVRGETISKPARVKAGGVQTQIAHIPLDDVRLWDGRADPYLYSVTVEVRDGGRIIDRVTEPLGIRSFRFDPVSGFYLNGKHLKLHGVSRHQDRYGKGWALTREDHAEDMALIAELGANTVRQAHYQHADEWSDEADKAGMVVWAEVPYVTTPSLRGGPGSQALWANAEQQLRELIRQNYNHPAIMMWSIGNEVDSAKGFGVKGDPPKPLALLQHLNQIARAEDPTRSTAFADCCEDMAMMETAGEKLAGTAELVGYNRYFGWYMPQPLNAREQLGVQMDKFHAKHPALPISISEYGAGGAISQHSDNISAGFLNFMGRPQPEEFLSFVHEENWPAIRERDYIFASWVWNMFDFTSDLREEGDSIDLNTKGLVTFDRKVKKDAFYYYKAQWNPDPMIALTGKRYAERAYPVMDVKAYSNAENATLTMNGVAVGNVPCRDRICIWSNVALRPGANEAAVSASINGTRVTDTAVWDGIDPAQGICVDAGDLAGRQLGRRRCGSDNFVTGGTPMVLNMGGFGGRRMPPRHVEAAEPELYEYWREGDAFSYAIPVPDGRWKVTVHTFEPRPAALDTQTMTVRANGTAVLGPVNVKRVAGGVLKGISRTFPVTVKGGVLRLDFAGQGAPAVVAGIEVSE